MPISPRVKNRFPFTLVLVCLILLSLFFIIYKKQTSRTVPAIQDINLENPNTAEVPPTDDLTSQQEHPQHLESEDNTVILPEDETTDILENKCKKVGDRISLFLSPLSEQEYIEAYEISENISDYLNKIIIKLLNNPPIITSESNDFLSILENAAHFYRVLGQKDVSLIKDIFIYEGEGLESILADLYQWSLISNECPNSQVRFSLPLKKTYEYSCFFLNTLAGQSYLFRRESRSRILIKYYSLLILNNAEQNGLNKYNLSTENILQETLEDMQEAHFLINKDLYIKNLLQIESRQKSTSTTMASSTKYQ